MPFVYFAQFTVAGSTSFTFPVKNLQTDPGKIIRILLQLWKILFHDDAGGNGPGLDR